MVRKLNNSEEVKAAILAALLNEGGSVSLADSLAIVYEKKDASYDRSIQLANHNLIFTINLDGKKSVTKRGANKIVDSLLDLLNVKDFTYLIRIIINNIIRLLKKEKAVTSIICNNDCFTEFSEMIEGVNYIVKGVRFKVEGDKTYYFVHVYYENLAKKINKKYAVTHLKGTGEYAIGDPVKERFYYTTNPIATFLNLVK